MKNRLEVTVRQLEPHALRRCRLNRQWIRLVINRSYRSKTLAQKIRLPNEVRDLALNAQAHRQTLCANQLDSNAVLSCFNQLDLWRRPERFEQVLEALEISEQKPLNFANELEQAAKQARAVNPQQFIAQGIKGADIKTALEKARLKIIQRYFS